MIRLVSYASPAYTLRQFFLNQTARLSDAAQETSSWNPSRLKKEGFAKVCTEISLTERGGGWWAWKPFIILRELENLRNGDWLLYCDTGRGYPFKIFDRPINLLVDWTLRSAQPCLPGVYIPWNGPMSQWTKRDAFVLTEMDEARFHAASPIQASFSIWRADDQSRHLVKVWLNWCSQRRLVTDDANFGLRGNFPNFQEHRHDQSLLTLLCMKHGLAGLNLGTCKPFFDEKHPSKVCEFLGEPAKKSSQLKFAQILSQIASSVEYLPRLISSKMGCLKETMGKNGVR